MAKGNRYTREFREKALRLLDCIASMFVGRVRQCFSAVRGGAVSSSDHSPRKRHHLELAKKIRRRRPDILRTIQLGYSNARLEASDNRIKVTIRMAYGFHHANNPIALIMLRRGGLDIRPPQPRTQPTKPTEASYT